MKTHTLIIVALAAASITTPASASGQAHSPAQQKIHAAQTAIENNPKQHEPYNRLAMALAMRARETADPAYYDQALEAAQQSLRLAPDNYGAKKAIAWSRLGKHEFPAALQAAKELHRLAPDDITVYGYLVDAHTELGQYDQAEQAAQWMLDLRPGNVPGTTRAAHLRELFGDIDGAIDLMTTAYRHIPPHETEHLAWVLTHLSHLHLTAGRVDLAAELAQQALTAYPDYHYALAQLAHTRDQQGDHEQALALFQKHYAVAPHPENLYLVGQALEKLNRHNEAKAAYQEFEQGAHAEMQSPDNANRDLIFYYTDHANNPKEALRIARMQINLKQDVYTLDAHAWALHANGQHDQARQQIDQALAVGTRDPKLFYHAGAIAMKQGDTAAAHRYFEKAASQSPASQWGRAATQAMAATR